MATDFGRRFVTWHITQLGHKAATSGGEKVIFEKVGNSSFAENIPFVGKKIEFFGYPKKS